MTHFFPTAHNGSRVCILIWIGLVLLFVGACGPSESPILFTSNRDGNLEIYSVSLGSVTETNLTKSLEDEYGPSVSPDRKMVAFLSRSGGETSIQVMHVDGSLRAPVAVAAAGGSSYRWSPTNKRIAYMAGTFPSPLIYISNVDGSKPVLLTSIPGKEVGDWSKDGISVVFAVQNGQAQGIYVRNPDGVNELRVTETPDYNPTWSPDSRRLAFISTRDENPEVYVMNADGSGQKRLTQTDAPEYHLSWSPNGKHLLFVSERDGDPEIYVTELDGSNQRQLTNNHERDEQPVWSPDGEMIVFVSYLDGDGEIIVMDSNGQNQVRLTNNAAADTDPSW